MVGFSTDGNSHSEPQQQVKLTFSAVVSVLTEHIQAIGAAIDLRGERFHQVDQRGFYPAALPEWVNAASRSGGSWRRIKGNSLFEHRNLASMSWADTCVADATATRSKIR
jgi:hypothetical protein